jgi:hypothetical protein
MTTKYLNQTYTGSDIPISVGDRYYGQDRGRDFYNNREYGALIARSIVNRSGNTIINGGLVSQGAGHTINVTSGFGVVAFQIKAPTSWSALPPPIGNVDIPIIVEIPALTNQSITGATTDGVTINYVKIAYTENFVSTRTRAKDTGSYSAETESSYTLTVNSTAPTMYELQLARFTSNGSTLTFVGSEARGVQVSNLNTNLITSDYTVTDADGYQFITVDASTTMVTITLPVRANNVGRPLIIKNKEIGVVKILRAGSDTIDGQTEIYLLWENDYIELIADSTEWKIQHIRQKKKSGLINQADWTNRELGEMEWVYDNLSGTFEIGELVTETGGNACVGRVLKNTGTVLTVYNVTNGGVVADGNQLTGGSSGATADSNEGTTSKNKDRPIYNPTPGKTFLDYKFELILSENNAIDTTTFNQAIGNIDATPNYGTTKWYVDATNTKIRTGTGGLVRIPSAGGSAQAIAAQNWYYEIQQLLEF